MSSGLQRFRKPERALRRAKDARARVALEGADPRRVGCTIHPEADEDTALRALLLLLDVGSPTRMIGMGTPSVRDDRTPEPFARPARRADVSVQRRACEEDVVLRRSKAYRVVGNANCETTGYRSTGPRVCLVALS